MQITRAGLQTPLSNASERSEHGWQPVRSRSLLAAYARVGDIIGAGAVIAWIHAAYDAASAVIAVLTAVALIFAWTESGVYERSVSVDARRLFSRLIGGTTAAAGFLFVVGYFLDPPFAVIAPALWTGGAVMAIAATVRLVLATIARRWRADGGFARMTVVIGTTAAAARYVEQARQDGNKIVGVFAPDGTEIGTTFAGCPIIGTFADIPHHPFLRHVDRVAVANFELPRSEEDGVVDMLRRLRSFPYEVDLAIEPAGTPNLGTQDSAPARALPILVRPLAGGGALVKGLFDRAAATLLLILLSPALCVIAIAIRLDTPGPALFRQPRPGLGEATIGIFKFRTMRSVDLAGTVETVPSDPRITRVGGFLRRYRLDELPQLINVIMGEMSLVGPRPLPPQAQLDHGIMGDILREHARRRAVKPGITGWAQVNGHKGPCRTAESLQQRIELDLYYINHWSFWLDLRILWRTIWVVLHHDEVA